MEEKKRGDRILVVSSESELADLVKEAVGGSFEVLYASSRQQGLDRARKEFPGMIVLGALEQPGAAFELHRLLREGWITRNIPLLVADLNPQDPARRVLSTEEGLLVEADEYIPLGGGGDQAAVSRLAEPIARLGQRVKDRLKERVNLFQEALLSPEAFAVTWEQIPGRGAFEMQQEELIENARRAVRKGKIHAISVTDNPGGNPAISTEILCTEVKKLGIEPLVHLAFRDKNRNECESLLYGLAALGVRNLLMLTGDYPSINGFLGRPKPVFDLDSVQGLHLAEMMNRGMEHEAQGKKTLLAPTAFFAGAAVSPFKQSEAELLGQYYKLRKKIEAGAKFLIPQLGYDARKLHELLLWLKVQKLAVPVMANIYLLPYGAGKIMNANRIPGCVVPDSLLARLDEERKAKDKGRQARLDRAAKMYAMAKGMGYAGAHIGGHGATYEMVEYIVDRGEELAPNWRDFLPEFDFPQKEGFYFFQKDEKSGLNLETPSPRKEKAAPSLSYFLSRLAHVTLFNPQSVLFKALRPVARLVDASPKLKSAFGTLEHINKVILFECMNCGDCALFDVAFLCPMSQCPKSQRNGPCGGSFQGWCEVHEDKKCVWVRAYGRLKRHQEEESIGENTVPPANWELQHTSSWLNFYLGRDHSARRLGIEPPKGQEAPPEEKKPPGEKKPREEEAGGKKVKAA